MTMSSRPRPILKRDSPIVEPTLTALPFSTCGNVLSPHVHFPPTPRISSQHPAYSPRTYDRAPIVVSPNACQLPQRGARKLCSPAIHFEVERRGRSRSRSRNPPDVKGSYFHPRAYEACKPEPLDGPAPPIDLPIPPSLMQDLSPSDESDDSITTPPDSKPSSTISASMSLSFDHDPESESFIVQAHSVTDSIHSFALPQHRMLQGGGEGKQQRPNLVRRKDKTRSGELSVSWDEGCLGGF